MSGDNYQLPPVFDKINYHQPKRVSTAGERMGYRIYNLITSTNTIMLGEIKRTGDEEYAALQNIVRDGVYDDSTIATIRKQENADLPEPENKQDDYTPSLVSLNDTKQALHDRYMQLIQPKIEEPPILVLAVFKPRQSNLRTQEKHNHTGTPLIRAEKVQPLTNAEIAHLRTLSDKSFERMEPAFYLYIGAVVLVTHNLALRYGLANGTRGIIVGWQYPEGTIYKPLIYKKTPVLVPVQPSGDKSMPIDFVLVEIDSKETLPILPNQPPNLPRNVVAIPLMTMSIKQPIKLPAHVRKTEGRKQVGISIVQLPIRQAQLLTLFNCQGGQFNRYYISEVTHPNQFYIPFSRGKKTIKHISIRFPITSAFIDKAKPSKELVAETARLQALHVQTKQRLGIVQSAEVTSDSSSSTTATTTTTTATATAVTTTTTATSSPAVPPSTSTLSTTASSSSTSTVTTANVVTNTTTANSTTTDNTATTIDTATTATTTATATAVTTTTTATSAPAVPQFTATLSTNDTTASNTTTDTTTTSTTTTGNLLGKPHLLLLLPPPLQEPAPPTELPDQNGFNWKNMSCAMDTIATTAIKVMETLSPDDQVTVARGMKNGQVLLDCARGNINYIQAKEQYLPTIYYRGSEFTLGEKCEINDMFRHIVIDTDRRGQTTTNIPMHREAFHMTVNQIIICTQDPTCPDHNIPRRKQFKQTSLLLPQSQHGAAFESIEDSYNSYLDNLREIVCTKCSNKLHTPRRTVSTMPIILRFMMQIEDNTPIFFMDNEFIMNDDSNDNVCVYVLAGVIYKSPGHFTSRYVDARHNVYHYDGMINKGKCTYLGPFTEYSFPTRDDDNYNACIALYKFVNVRDA
jgi:hypothetical protein